MKNLFYRIFGLFVALFVLLLAGGLYWTPPAQPSLWEYGKHLAVVLAIDLAFVYGFNRWFWQWKIWHPWLMPFPNLKGTWQGEIRSEWIDPKTKQKLEPIPAQLTIRQTFLEVHCTMKTKEMNSESTHAAFDWSKGSPQLTYTYTSSPKPNVKDRSEPHKGTMFFNFTHEGSKKLEGEYWTERKTTGQATFYFKDTRPRYDADHLTTHPAHAIDNNAMAGQIIQGNVNNTASDQGTNVSGNVQGDVNISHHHHKDQGDS